MIMTKVLFGGDLEEDNREYAASTFIHKDCTENKANCLPGEGNMFLHGGVAIQGDISVERHLITSNRSYEKYAGHHWLHSYYPSAKSARIIRMEPMVACIFFITSIRRD